MLHRKPAYKKLRELISSDLKMDLHIHTCYSDGVLTPQEVADRWKAEGYELISITDHDGIEGTLIGMDYCAGIGLRAIPGIEFDSEDKLGKDMHILGYGIDHSCRELSETLLEVLLKRARRNDALMAALIDMGYDITLDDIGRINEGRFVGKPTFARILKKKGYIDSPQDAFRTIFRDDRIRKIKKETLSSETVVDLIHKAGGLAVLAHPMEQRHLREPWEDFVPRLYGILDQMVAYGIDGIECRHPSADEAQTELLLEYAASKGLAATRGSDFHSDRHKRNFARYHI